MPACAAVSASKVARVRSPANSRTRAHPPGVASARAGAKVRTCVRARASTHESADGAAQSCVRARGVRTCLNSHVRACACVRTRAAHSPRARVCARVRVDNACAGKLATASSRALFEGRASRAAAGRGHRATACVRDSQRGQA
eukprot:6205891-Pleurochrysis_carterae.AAC.5